MISFDKLSGETYTLIADSDSTLYAGGTYGVLRWNGGFWKPVGENISGAVHALAVDANGTLYAGGDFPGLKNIARWDGKSWSPLGTGTKGVVLALLLNSAGQVVAGGRFDSIGGVRSKYVGKWDGNSWAALDSGILETDPYLDVTNGVNVLVMDKSGNLFAGGNFNFAGTFTSVAKWDGKKWSALGDFYNNADGITYGLAFDAQGNLYAGGSLLAQPTADYGYDFLVWDGKSWTSCDGGTNITVTALASDHSGNIYLGGEFYTVGANDLGANGFAKYNPATGWKSLDTSASNRETINALAVNPAGKLFAGGGWRIVSQRGPYVETLREDSLQWKDVAAKTTVNSIVVDYRKNIYAAGDFTTVGGIVARHIGQWDGNQWRILGKGINGAAVNVILTDSNGNVYAGGTFDSAGSVAAKNIAKWNGSAWSALGSGLQGGLVNGQPPSVNALAFDANGKLVVGGNFQTAGSAAAKNIAQWDGSSWSAVGAGTSGVVMAAAFRKQDNSIYIGGDFTNVGNTPFNNIGRWDGKAWFPLGSGVTGSIADWVEDLSVDSVGKVFVGGNFNSSGNNIAVWSGAGWNSVGSGVSSGNFPGKVNSVTVRNDKEIYIGGSFSAADGVPSRSTAKWDGLTWDSLGSGLNSNVLATALCDSFLYVGGIFDTAGGKYIPGFAKVNIKGTTVPPVVVQPHNANGSNYGFRFENSKLIVTGIQPMDFVSLYALDGRPMGKFKGLSVVDLVAGLIVDLKNLSSRLVLVRIEHSGKVVSSGIVLLK